MTREETKELLPVIHAFADGKEIQHREKRADAQWTDCLSPIWSGECEWRVKPEPREFWVVYDHDLDRLDGVYAYKPAQCHQRNELIHVREVL